MADLTDEEQIVIGVTVSIAAIVFIAFIVILCCYFYRKDKRRSPKKRIVKDKIINRDFYYDRPYSAEHKIHTRAPPPMMMVPPPYRSEPPPPAMYRSEAPQPAMYRPEPPPPAMYQMRSSGSPSPRYARPHRIEPYVVKADQWDTRSEPPVDAVEKRYYGEVQRSGYDDIYHNEPIVIPLSTPEYVYAGMKHPPPQTHYIRYHDDQALLRQSRPNEITHPLRRTHSASRQTDIRRTRDQPYVGEWEVKPDGLNTFNQEAWNRGRDPFLWKK